jgi:hypothetical protein
MTASCAYKKRRPIFTAETQRKARRTKKDLRTQRWQRAQRRHFSLILCVSAVTIRS